MLNKVSVHRVVVPVDGSDCSRYAADHAVRIAQAAAAELIFLYVIDEQLVSQLAGHESGEGVDDVRERLSEKGRTCLHDAARAAANGGVTHQEIVCEGDPCAAICDAAERSRADLIVIGKIGHRGARRIVLGSITRRVIECSERPVLVITQPLTA